MPPESRPRPEQSLLALLPRQAEEDVGPGLLLTHVQQDQKDPTSWHECVHMPAVMEQHQQRQQGPTI